MLSKQRLPDLVVIAIVAMLLLALNYFGKMHIIADYPFIFLLLMYFVGRAVTWYVISRHTEE